MKWSTVTLNGESVAVTKQQLRIPYETVNVSLMLNGTSDMQCELEQAGLMDFLNFRNKKPAAARQQPG